MKKALLGLALATAISTSAFGYTLANNNGNSLNVSLESSSRVTGAFESTNPPVEFNQRFRYNLAGKAKVDDQYTIGFFGRAENSMRYNSSFGYTNLQFRKAILNVSKAGLGSVSVSFLDADQTFGTISLGTASGVLKNFKSSGAYGEVYRDSMSRSVKFVSEKFGDNVYALSYADSLKGTSNTYEVDGNVKTTLADKRVLSSSVAFKVLRTDLGKTTEGTSYKAAVQLHYTDESLANDLKAELAGQAAYATATKQYGLSVIGKLSYKVNNYFKPYLGSGFQYSKTDTASSKVFANTFGFASDLYSSKLVNVTSYLESSYEYTEKAKTTTKDNSSVTTTTKDHASRYEAGVTFKF